ncbi:AMP deaminase [Perkinsus chesapeaki]|uniref:AMP deaminase n=1 Tax=Perkinsus chesapeaki TaxID=330153 RepID=A0A7J6LM22_PERCH|nr:AMP deaminase [Perkinsus chesapeaki]
MCAANHNNVAGPPGMPEDIKELIRGERSIRQNSMVIDEPAFEGTEKRIEIDFVWSGDELDMGARIISRPMWDKILSLCECTIVSHKALNRFDAYVLSESSLFVYPEKIIIKTCGTTLLLQGLRTLLGNEGDGEAVVESGGMKYHAVNEVGLELEWLFYSRKSFLFPEFQKGVHCSLEDEVRCKFFGNKVCSKTADYMTEISGISDIYPGAKIDAINFTPWNPHRGARELGEIVQTGTKQMTRGQFAVFVYAEMNSIRTGRRVDVRQLYEVDTSNKRVKLRVYENEKEIVIETVSGMSDTMDLVPRRPSSDRVVEGSSPLPALRRAFSARGSASPGLPRLTTNRGEVMARLVVKIGEMLDNDEIFVAEEIMKRFLATADDKDVIMIRKHRVFKRLEGYVNEIDALLLKLVDDRKFELKNSGGGHEGKIKIWLRPSAGSRIFTMRSSGLIHGDFLDVCTAIETAIFPGSAEVISRKEINAFSSVLRASVDVPMVLRKRQVNLEIKWLVNEREGYALLRGKSVPFESTVTPPKRYVEMLMEDIIVLLVPMAQDITFITKLMVADPRANLVGLKLMEITAGRNGVKQMEGLQRRVSKPEKLKEIDPLPRLLRNKLGALKQRRLLPNREKRRSSIELMNAGWVSDTDERLAR